MLEPPPIALDELETRLRQEYGLAVETLVFLPLGADANSAVYRVQAGGSFFLKLRRDFSPLGVEVPRFLRSLGIEEIVPVRETRAGQPWASLGEWTMILSPFLEGQDGYHARLTAAQWQKFGATLARIHAAPLPPALAAQVPRVVFSPRWRRRLRGLLRLARTREAGDSTAAAMAALLIEQDAAIQALLAQAARLAAVLRRRARPALALCHTDLHPGNLLIGGGRFAIVDWDAPLLAPKERDLMFFGAGLGLDEPAMLSEFFAGYGPVRIDPAWVAYFRSERIIEDLALYAEDVLLTAPGGDDRAQALHYARSNFAPAGTIARAMLPRR